LAATLRGRPRDRGRYNYETNGNCLPSPGACQAPGDGKQLLEDSLLTAKRLGYDGIEILAGDPDAIDGEQVAHMLAKHSMKISAINTGGMNYMFDVSLINADAAKEDMAFRKLQSAIRVSGRLGCLTQIGTARGNAIRGKPIAYFRDRLVTRSSTL